MQLYVAAIISCKLGVYIVDPLVNVGGYTLNKFGIIIWSY